METTGPNPPHDLDPAGRLRNRGRLQWDAERTELQRNLALELKAGGGRFKKTVKPHRDLTAAETELLVDRW